MPNGNGAPRVFVSAPGPAPGSSDLLVSFLRVAAAAARTTTGASRAAAALPVDGASGAHSLIIQREGSLPPLPGGLIRLVARSVRGGRRLSLEDPGGPAALATLAAQAGARVMAAVSLRVEGAEGCLLAARDTRRPFSPAELAGLEGVAQSAALGVAEARALVNTDRRRFARELHDTFGQTLTALVFAVDELERGLQSVEERRLTSAVRSHALKALDDMRDVIAAVRRTEGEQERWRRVLDLAKDLSQSGIQVRVHKDLPEPLPAGLVECLYEVAREALLNVKRHARARNVHVLLWQDERKLEVMVSDDGQGLRPEELPGMGWGGFGLRMMQERLEEVGGAFIVESTGARGTRVIARIPWTGGERSHSRASTARRPGG